LRSLAAPTDATPYLFDRTKSGMRIAWLKRGLGFWLARRELELSLASDTSSTPIKTIVVLRLKATSQASSWVPSSVPTRRSGRHASGSASPSPYGKFRICPECELSFRTQSAASYIWFSGAVRRRPNPKWRQGASPDQNRAIRPCILPKRSSEKLQLSLPRMPRSNGEAAAFEVDINQRADLGIDLGCRQSLLWDAASLGGPSNLSNMLSEPNHTHPLARFSLWVNQIPP